MIMYFYDYHTHEYTGPDDVPEDIALPDDYPATAKEPPAELPYFVRIFDVEADEWKQQMKPLQECFDEIEADIDKFIYETVAQKGYDSIDSLPKYLVSTNDEFRSDAEDALAWVTAVWEKVNELKNSFIAGEIQIMPPEQIVAELPVLEWRFPPRG